MRALSLVPGPMKELGDTLYQFRYPYVLDSSRSEAILGQQPTSLVDGTAATMAWCRRDAPPLGK